MVDIIQGLCGRGDPQSPYYLSAKDVFGGDTKAALTPNRISVISPFREQVWRIRFGLRKLGLHAVDVGDVESLQGAEKYVRIQHPLL